MTDEQRDPQLTPPSEPIGLWAQIREDWIAHGRDWTKPGFRAVAVHRFGVWRMKRPAPLRFFLSRVYRVMFRRCRNVYGIELPYTVALGRRVIVEHQGAIVVHGHCVIGDDCTIRQGVTLGNKNFDRPLDAPRLGRGVNVGAGAKLLGGIVVGDESAVGANAVLTKDLPARHTALGIPATIKPMKSIVNRPAETGDVQQTEAA